MRSKLNALMKSANSDWDVAPDEFAFVRCQAKRITCVTTNNPWNGKAVRLLAGQGAIHIQLKKVRSCRTNASSKQLLAKMNDDQLKKNKISSQIQFQQENDIAPMSFSCSYFYFVK
jgi:hypothetical protein